MDQFTNSINEDANQNLKNDAIKGLGWNVAGSIIKFMTSFIVNIVLARLLGPEPYGLVALSLIVISVGNLVIDSGLNSGLVQKKSIDDQDIKFVFTLQILLGLGIFILIFLLSPLLADLLRQQGLAPVIRVLSLSLLFQAATQTSIGLLKRKLDFQRLQKAQIISYLVGYLVLGVPLALLGKGVWSLVFAQLTQSFIVMAYLYFYVKHPIGFQLTDTSGIYKFGVKILGANLANWIISNLDSAIIGRYFGSVTLGLYNRAMTLAFNPLGIVVTASQGVIFSASSKLQDSIQNARKVFLRIVSLLSEILIPFSICFAIASSEIILAVYGPKWEQAVPFMRVLSIAFPFFAFMAIEGPILAGLGKPEIELHTQWIVAVIDIISLVIAVQFSISAVLWVVFGVYALRFIMMSIPTLQILRITKVDLLKRVLGGLALGLSAGSAVFLVGKLLVPTPNGVMLLFQILAGAIVWAGGIRLGSKYFFGFITWNTFVELFGRGINTIKERDEYPL